MYEDVSSIWKLQVLIKFSNFEESRYNKCSEGRVTKVDTCLFPFFVRSTEKQSLFNLSYPAHRQPDFRPQVLGECGEFTGGASALTPAEIREARQEADAEFEKEKDKKPGKKRRESKGGKGEAGEGDKLYGNVLAGKLQKSVEILRYKVSFILSIYGP